MILNFKETNVFGFTFSKKYLCFGIQFNEYLQTTEVSVRRDSDGTPSLVEIEKFEIIDSKIPPDWQVSFYQHGDNVRTFIEPREFDGDFWELYHDGDPKADALFEEVYARLCQFHNFPIEKYVL
ncbi:hypothetical protein F4V57_03610 [Acinetobacter qingfengensis]|uniref:Uncharacterized protein n=1 Tax=Acinetobacter qingfengensis TaxID=1262585 RepID=A0A1E7R1W2_9GAMM|nr:hypothetical protein [Acinetobacter qingfengensis]KAA8734857.1 hypothetical protein F4V57_03610 [Acinetobacter qingfengensis]OEY93299.1 hypothetical protein BJI46_14190 [Acinetobacter qingfengensis]